jgi:hypothetical protein
LLRWYRGLPGANHSAVMVLRMPGFAATLSHWRGWSTLAVVVVLVVLGGCSRKEAAGSVAKGRPPPLVAVVKAEARDIPVEVQAPVDLRPLTQADAVAKTIGYLDAVLVDRGDVVKAGQTVAVVRPSDLPDQLAVARGTLAQSQAQVTLARINLERAQKLAQEGLATQAELQSTTSALTIAEAMAQASKAQIGALATRLRSCGSRVETGAAQSRSLILMLSLMVLVLGFCLARAAVGRSVSRDHDPGDPGRDLLPGAGPADIEKSITEPVERAVAAAPGVDRVESASKQGVSVVSVWFAYGTEPGQRAVRGVAAGGADPQHAAAGGPAAVHHQVRHHQHPGGAGGGGVRRARRAAALRPGLQRHRAAARADPGGRQRHRRGRSAARSR